MASIDLYGLEMSAPCRAVLLGAKTMGVNMNLKITDIMSGANKTPEFLKMNIQHTIPTMDDSGFYMNESRAMLQYLANKYSKDDSLYPKDPKARAIVDMRLQFDQGTLYTRFADAYYSQIFMGQPRNEEKMEKLDEALGWLDVYLKDGFVAGSQMTIADFTIMATLATIEATGHDISKFSAVKAYFDKCKSSMAGYEEACGKGAAMFGGYAKSKIQG